jgi:repressor LexA
MENKQEGKGKRKGGDAPADTRQMDLWSAAQPAPAPETPSRNTAQAAEPVPIERAREHGRKTAGPAAPVKVTVSGASRHAADRFPGRTLPALTRRQHELLDYLRRRVERGELPPSLTEICRDLGLSSRGSLHKQIVALVRANLVEPMLGKQRGVRLTPGSVGRGDGEVALLGAIAAGRPIEALTRDETVRLPEWLRSTADCYALRVRGDSMRDAGILDGDLVVVESRSTARNGEMVVALVDGESATLKRIEQKPGEVLLHAENPAYPPQRYAPERVAIQGVVVAQLRRY